MHFYNFHPADFNNSARHLTLVERALYRDLIDMYYGDEQPIDVSDVARLERRLLCRTQDEKAALAYVLSEFFVKRGNKYHHHRIDREIKNYRHAHRNDRVTATVTDNNAHRNERNGNSNATVTEVTPLSNAERQQRNRAECKQMIDDLNMIGVSVTTNAGTKLLRELTDINADAIRNAKLSNTDDSNITDSNAHRNDSVTDSNAEIRANNQEPETNNHKPVTNTNKAKAAGVDSVTAMEWFDEFYALYPVKKSKGDALKAWQKIFLGDSKTKPVENPQAYFEKIMTGLRLNLEHITAQLNRGYGKHPSTWLNGMGWDDVHEAPEPQNQSRFGTAADPMAVDVVWNQPLRTEPAMSFDEMMAEMNANTHSPVDFLGN